MSEKTCSISGCERKYSCKGHCVFHYDRIRRGVDPTAAERGSIPRAVVCAHSGCEQLRGNSKFCPMHSARHYQGRDMNTPKQNTGICHKHPDSVRIHRRKSAPNGFCADCTRIRLSTWTNWAKRAIKSTKDLRRLSAQLRETSSLEPQLTVEWLLDIVERQGRKCYYTRVVLDPGAGTHSPFLPSLDRIDNGKGYTKDNIRITSLGWNRARNVASIEEGKTFFKLVDGGTKRKRPPTVESLDLFQDPASVNP